MPGADDTRESMNDNGVQQDIALPENTISFVVGIGASAGGIEAFGELLETLPADTGMAFIFVQHLDPFHESVLDQIFQRKSAISVEQAADGMMLQPDHVYIIPPNKNIGITDGKLVLSPRQHDGPKFAPIDAFFTSLADAWGKRAIGVILSGTGSDGTQGLLTIKAQRGLAFAQDQASALYPDMPKNAVACGAADFVLPPASIAQELSRLAKNPLLMDHSRRPPVSSSSHGTPGISDDRIARIEEQAALEKQIAENQELNARLLDREAVIDLLTSELRTTQRLLEESRDRYGDLYDFAPVGYITVSHNGVIEESNATFAGMMGMDQRTVLSVPFSIFLASPEDLGLFLNHLNRCRTEGTKINTELKLKHRSGAVLDVQLSSVPSADYANRTVVYRTVVIDITDRKQAERAREGSRRQLQLIIDAAPVPIGYLDQDQRFVFVNAEYLNKFSLPHQEVLGHTFDEVHGVAAEVLFGDRFEKGIAGVASEFEGEVTCLRSGDTFFLRVNIAPDCEPGSSPCGFIIVATDLTYQKRLLQEAQEAKQAAENANSAKSQFLSNMSHELRTPMNGILGTIQLLLNGYAEPLQTRQREFLTKTLDAGKSLLRILNDLLDMSRIEAGSLSIEQESMSIRRCAQEAVELFVDKAQQKGISLSSSISDQVPQQVWGDFVRLRQVLINLIDNAIKFTERGEVVLDISALPGSSDETVEILFRISDTGIGISADKKDKLFKPLSQLDESHTRRYGGTGSGLSISEKIIQMMGGTINLESNEGSGSSFSFSIPFRVEAVTQGPAPLKAEDVPVAAPVNHNGKVRILVAEDDVLAGEILGKVLEIEGFDWDVVHDGQEAVAKWEQNTYGLIIMDVQMPKMDGLTATRIIREKENPAGRHTPIVAITAFANKEDEDYCLKIGMDAFLPKPLDLKKGIQVISCLTRRDNQTIDCSAFEHPA